MRETPETDAAWKEGNAIREWTCRKLERERDEARERCAKFRDIAERAVSLGIKGKTGRIKGIVEYFNGITKFAFKGKTK